MLTIPDLTLLFAGVVLSPAIALIWMLHELGPGLHDCGSRRDRILAIAPSESVDRTYAVRSTQRGQPSTPYFFNQRLHLGPAVLGRVLAVARRDSRHGSRAGRRDRS